MAKRVFFSFHYQDVIDFRANVVRNHWLTKPDRSDAGFFDASIWESAKKTSDLAVKRLINDGLYNTSNTCVLIGSDTYTRRWVRYEIMKSFERGNHLFGVHINQIKDKYSETKSNGNNPFEYLGVRFKADGSCDSLWEWKEGKWVEFDDLKSCKLQWTARANLKGEFSTLDKFYPCYCWVKYDGYNKFTDWVK